MSRLIRRRLPAATDLLRLHRLAPVRYPMLLESSAHALDASARLHAHWDMLLVADGEGFERAHDGVLRDLHGPALTGGFLDYLEREWQAWRQVSDPVDADLPFRGGWAVFCAYELAEEIEPTLHIPVAGGHGPLGVALRCPAAILRDHASGECFAIAEPGREAWIDQIEADLRVSHAFAEPSWHPPTAVGEDEPQRFLDGVAAVLRHLRDGDIYQANLSRGWWARFAQTVDPAALHARLRAANPAPFSGVFVHGDWAVASSSPERLATVRGDIASTRPIAGTRPRVAGDDDDARIRELIDHPKERAEHVMLVDLERNDLGRVCVGGTVEVDELMTVESYAHVHHIVSNVRGVRLPDASPVDVLRAVFPGGTITGCPKVSCMRIIAAQEGIGRGAYTGAMGWINRDGDMDFNILIRTAEVEGDTLRFRTGAGIVLQSAADRELAETRAKARGLLRALGMED
ncbi:MAG: aminodeoxychorismate synthase component I [Proteobacteria bacterium]|nr:aminodeoxychorismate synthase component I [Pseudomonadota bacterium]